MPQRTTYPAGNQLLVSAAAASALPAAAVGGTANAITGTFTPPITPLADSAIVLVRATGANTIANPTFNADGSGAVTITRYGGQALVVGDIVGVGHELALVYSQTANRWELLNPGGVFEEGAIHGRGLVPDPGATPGTSKFLREDATWATVPASPTNSFFINAAAEFGVSTTGDQATNIQNALNAASTTSGRGTVVLPSGLITIGSGIAIPAGISLIGQGKYATNLEMTGTTVGAMIDCSAGSGIQVRDMGVTVLTGHSVGIGIYFNGNQQTECLVDNINLDSTIGLGTITNGIAFGGSVGGYFNRVSRSRIKSCSNGVGIFGTAGLEALLSELNISTCAVGVVASANSGYFSMVKVECLSCTNLGIQTQDCNFEAVNCLVDNSTNNNWQSVFTTTTGMPITGWYLRIIGCRGSFAGGRGMEILNNNAAGGVILNCNLVGCDFYDNGSYGLTITAPNTPANTRAKVTGCIAGRNATAGAADGMYFNNVDLMLSGSGGFNTQNGGDGILIDVGCTGRSVGNIGSGNTGQNVNVAATSGVLSLNDRSTNTRTVAQLPAAATVGANSRAYVTDANAVTFSTVVAGLGVNTVPVYSDGTNWRIG